MTMKLFIAPIIIITWIILQAVVTIEGQTTENIVGQACNKTVQCSTTCGKIIFCENEKIPNEGVDCPASHPHCVTDIRADRCSNVADPTRPQCSEQRVTDFFCTDEGYFPGKYLTLKKKKF